jgi:hypothetical protein
MLSLIFFGPTVVTSGSGSMLKTTLILRVNGKTGAKVNMQTSPSDIRNFI